MKITQGAAVGLGVLLAIIVVGFSVGGVVVLKTVGDASDAADRADSASRRAVKAEGRARRLTRDLAAYQARSCRRGRRSARDNAAGWTRHAWYIKKVTQAASVQEDVKRVARVAASTYTRIAANGRRRARIECPAPPK